MPSVSKKQANFMSAIAHGWQPPQKHAPSRAVAEEFHAADKKVGKWEHAEGGKVEGLRAALDAMQARLKRIGSQHFEPGYDPYNSADAAAKRAAEEAEAAKHLPVEPGYADGGSVDQPIDPSRTNRLLALVSHAADRATSTVTDDPHHALARVAAGLASQVAGQSPSGGVQFGKMPNLINEIKSLPAAAVDIGNAGSQVLGGLARKYLPQYPGTIGNLLARLQDADSAYLDKHGDPAPNFAREAEARSDAVHSGVNRAMGLSTPKGFVENLADAGGNMLGQLPLPAGEAKTAARGIKGGLAALARAIPEYLGPTVRPSLRNYATGALGGGAMGALASSDDEQPLTQSPDYGTMGPKTRFEAAGGPVRMGKGGKVSTLIESIQALLKNVADPATWEKIKDIVIKHPEVHETVQNHLLNLGHTPTSLHRPDFYMVEALSGALNEHKYDPSPETANFLHETLNGAREQHLGTGKEPWPGYNAERAEYDGTQGIDELREVYGPEGGVDTGTKQ